ncbi:MAG: tetratricopeptide repeat protein [Sulfurimonadaceae bacterium]
MRFYLISLSIFILLTGCGSAPDVALVPKLSHYTTAKQQCSDFLDGKSEFNSAVEKECDQFIKRLEKANSTAHELESKKLKKGEALQKETLYARERLKVKHQYDKLSEAVKEATLAAIKKDNVVAFAKGIAFPGNSFIAPYYDYMKSKAPQFDNNTLFLDYQYKESEQLMLKGEHTLKQGKTDRALALFEEAANLGNAQAARSTGLLYENSNPEKALHWHNQAVDGGVKASYLNLGRLYEADGQNELALQWYLKSAAENNSKAQYQLYLLFLDKDKSRALSWLQKSASNGYAHAQYSYALILMKERKTDEAIDLLQQASQNNYTQASDYLGTYFYDLKLFESAFKQLAQSESANSFYLRAKMSEEGAGVERDYKLAYTFYARASSLGTKNVDKDLQRVNRLLTKEQQRLASEEKRVRTEQMAKMVKACGSVPTRSNIKKRDRRFHITGRASAPVGRQSFIIYGDDGENYYLLRARGIQEDDRVDITVISTGSTASISSADDDEAVDIYQFTFLKECVIEEEEQ